MNFIIRKAVYYNNLDKNTSEINEIQIMLHTILVPSNWNFAFCYDLTI